jgi:iron(III) transport system ATP-binding protein
MTTIEIRHLSKSLGQVSVLERFSLKIMDSESVVVLGPSGSGKTTLLRLIAGLETPDAGEILLDGVCSSRPGWVLPAHRRKLGMVFQSPALWPHMTAAENIHFGLAHLNIDEARQRIFDLLSDLGLDGLSRRYPHELSGGEARRVALARALAPHPRLLLMDEPLTNLNPELIQQSLATIQAHLEKYHPTLVYVTHDSAEAASISSRVIALSRRSGT